MQNWVGGSVCAGEPGCLNKSSPPLPFPPEPVYLGFVHMFLMSQLFAIDYHLLQTTLCVFKKSRMIPSFPLLSFGGENDELDEFHSGGFVAKKLRQKPKFICYDSPKFLVGILSDRK